MSNNASAKADRMYPVPPLASSRPFNVGADTSDTASTSLEVLALSTIVIVQGRILLTSTINPSGISPRVALLAATKSESLTRTSCIAISIEKFSTTTAVSTLTACWGCDSDLLNDGPISALMSNAKASQSKLNVFCNV